MESTSFWVKSSCVVPDRGAHLLAVVNVSLSIELMIGSLPFGRRFESTLVMQRDAGSGMIWRCYCPRAVGVDDGEVFFYEPRGRFPIHDNLTRAVVFPVLEVYSKN